MKGNETKRHDTSNNNSELSSMIYLYYGILIFATEYSTVERFGSCTLLNKSWYATQNETNFNETFVCYRAKRYLRATCNF